MIILDTNVLSALMRQNPERQVIAWLDRQPRPSLWTTSVTILEIQFGLLTLPVGKRRAGLIRAFESLLEDKMERRVAPFDLAAAQKAGELMAARTRIGRPVELRDKMIAGIALACRAALAMRVAHGKQRRREWGAHRRVTGSRRVHGRVQPAERPVPGPMLEDVHRRVALTERNRST